MLLLDLAELSPTGEFFGKFDPQIHMALSPNFFSCIMVALPRHIFCMENIGSMLKYLMLKLENAYTWARIGGLGIATRRRLSSTVGETP
jgi:hypothetical protein